MSDFTYQEKATSSKLETLEWDNTWWEQTADTVTTRVLYIGDSISCGTRRLCTANSNNKILVDGFGTSKAIDNPYFKESVELFARQQSHTDLILFNNGLHGFHLNSEEYGKYYCDFVDFLKKKFPKTPIIIVLTTDVSGNEQRTKEVVARNEKALKTAKEKGCFVADLFTLSQENSSLHTSDGVHFTEQGYSLLANALIEKIEEIIK